MLLDVLRGVQHGESKKLSIFHCAKFARPSCGVNKTFISPQPETSHLPRASPCKTILKPYAALPWLAVCLAACDGDEANSAKDSKKPDVVIGPDGAAGMCCPVTDLTTATCGSVAKGGWTTLDGGCSFVADAAPAAFEAYTDDYGCPALRQVSNESCFLPPAIQPDVGFDAGDAGNG